MSRMTIKGVEATKIKTHRGEDGVGYNATLVIDGRPVASIFNGGDGGPTYLRDVKDRAAVERFEAAVKALPPYPLDMGGGETKPVEVCTDFFLGMLVDDTLEDARIAKLCKTNLVLRRPTDEPGSYLTIKTATIDQKLRDHVAKKHPTAEIVNDRLGIFPGVVAPKTAKPKRAKARA